MFAIFYIKIRNRKETPVQTAFFIRNATKNLEVTMIIAPILKQNTEITLTIKNKKACSMQGL